MAFNAVLFDLDGALADTRPWYQEILTSGLGLPERDVRTKLIAHHPPIRIAMDHGITRSRLLAACRSARARVRLFPRARETITGLQARKVPLGLVTSCPSDLTEIVLEATDLRSLFDVIQPYQARVRPKPRPDSLLRALGILGVPPSLGVAYIGDTVGDSQAAASAGLSFGWVSFGYGDGKPPDTTWTIARLDTLLEIADL